MIYCATVSYTLNKWVVKCESQQIFNKYIFCIPCMPLEEPKPNRQWSHYGQVIGIYIHN